VNFLQLGIESEEAVVVGLGTIIKNAVNKIEGMIGI